MVDLSMAGIGAERWILVNSSRNGAETWDIPHTSVLNCRKVWDIAVFTTLYGKLVHEVPGSLDI